MGAANVAVVEGEGVAAAGGFPPEACLGEATFTALLGEVEVDVVEALAARIMLACAGDYRAFDWEDAKGTKTEMEQLT